MNRMACFDLLLCTHHADFDTPLGKIKKFVIVDDKNLDRGFRMIKFSQKTRLLAGATFGAAAFLAAASAINRLTALLSPLALGIIFFYSLTKRFTDATHFFLGLALAVAPAGALSPSIRPVRRSQGTALATRRVVQW